MTNYSLGEIDSLARKATRGAGYSWGISEEAGKSVRWLSAYGFLGAEILASYLELVANKSQEFTPSLRSDASSQNSMGENKDLDNIKFANHNNPVCPLYSGSLINDLGHLLKDHKTISFDNMLSPLLALSQAGRVAEAYDISVSFAFSDSVIICSAGGINVAGRNAADTENIKAYDTPPLLECFCIDSELLHEQSDVLCIRVNNTKHNTHYPSALSRPISAEAVSILERFAHTTYAPATEESRSKGAG